MLSSLRHYGFSPNSAEATYLRKLTRDCYDENEQINKRTKETGKISMDLVFTQPEIVERFLWNYYGINLQEYLSGVKKDDQDKAMKDLYKYIQEKLREERELI